MTQSILTSIKKLLGIDESYEAFDEDIKIHINSVFSTLQQLGIGPKDGYSISDKSELWGSFLGEDKRLSNVKSYVYLRVRLLFDPPNHSFLIESMRNQIKELEWRLIVQTEEPENPNG